MSRTYLPNSKQFKRINEQLRNIAGSLAWEQDPTTWVGVQKIVERGLAPKYFPVGSQLVANHFKYGDIIFDVVAHDYLKSCENKNAHTMTLLSHDTIPFASRFDQPEAFYYTEVLNPGTYCFTLAYDCYDWLKGTYYFTIDSYQENVQLAITRLSNEGMTSAKVTVHPAGQSYEILRTNIYSGSKGTNLGTLGVELNHPQRVYAGSNNYMESNIRQYLNSEGEAGIEWWQQKTKYDRHPSWFEESDAFAAGFMQGWDLSFIVGVATVNLPCSSNNQYETPDGTIEPNSKYVLKDKFYLPSQMEIFGHHRTTTVDDSKQFPYFEEATNTDRFKYTIGSTSKTGWMTRSSFADSACDIQCVNTDGWLTNSSSARNFAVACTIVGNV